MKWTNALKHFFMFLICIQLICIGLPTANNQALAKPKPSQKVEVNPEAISGLAAKVDVVEDEFGIPHLFAKSLDDVYFMQGFLHARDRFFQMDVTRRTVDGTLSEILGPGDNNSNLSSDVQLRGLNLKDAVNKAFPMMQKETRDALKAYTKGVNAYLNANPLPPEYQALKITQKRMWTETDCLLVGKGLALSLSFDTGDIANTLALQNYQDAGMKQNFNGTALFFEDVFRIAPFDPTFAIPDATGKSIAETSNKVNNQERQARLLEQQEWAKHISENIKPETLEMAQDYLDKVKNIPLLANGALGHDPDRGSNWFILSGKLTDSGSPLLNNDPHLSFGAPPIWYQIQLNVTKGKKKLLNVTGVSLAGVPGVVLGHNDDIAWGATTSNFDVTDVYQEQVDAQFGGVSIIHDGKKEPVIFRDETFRINRVTDGKTDNLEIVPPSSDVPGRFPSVPRRNGGPIISINLTAQTALTLQFTGFGPTFEVETFLGFNKAKNLTDFKNALQFFDVGSQNFSVITTTGDMAYFTTGEVPIREDLEAGKVNGVPPYFIRNGVTGNEWLPVKNKQPNQILQYEILPFAELPQVVNPVNGFVVTANSDPIGSTASNNPLGLKRQTGGIYYLAGTGYASGARASRLTKDIQGAIASGKKITTEMARRFQADVRMRDAEILMPYILQAFANAQGTDAPAELAALAKDPAITEAVTRFKTWDFSTPTGLRMGYDAFVPYNQSEPSQQQVDNSVSTTIYSLWRSQMVRNTIDSTLQGVQLTRLPDNATTMAALRNLLDSFPKNKGKGTSGIFFFGNNTLTNASPEVQRDFVILSSLQKALTTLAGPDFALAFQGSTKQSDYRWGFLHRVVFPSMLGRMTDYTIPSANGNFRSPIPGLFGLPRDGGFDVPNASGHSVRAKAVNDFMFGSGPSKRSTIVMKPGAIDFTTAIPGGQSGSLTSKFRDNLLNFWLVADVYPLRDIKKTVAEPSSKVTSFIPSSEKK